MARRATLRACQSRKGYTLFFVLKWLFYISCGYMLYFTAVAHQPNPLVRLNENNLPQSKIPVPEILRTTGKTVVQERAKTNEKTLMNEPGQTTKDVFHVVTAASSKEFESLLKLIHSFTRSKVMIALWLWSLDLSSCEISYIENLNVPFTIKIEHFPFHVYPLHFRQFHLLAIKPIVLEIASLAFGHALWIDPNTVLTGSLAPLLGELSQIGYVVDSGRTNAIGTTYHKFETFRENWIKCVKEAVCMKNHTNRTNHSERDQALIYFMSQNKMTSRSFKNVLTHGSTRNDHSKFLDNWRNNGLKRCSKHKVCILTGNHQSHGCLTPQLGKLRKNKLRYSRRYGYKYIEETFGFHKSGPCNPNWNKVQAILKHLPDCKVLMWVDSDCVFTNPNKSIESHFEKYPDKDMLMNWPKTDKMLNSGVILMKSTKAIRDFFHNITTGENWTENWCNGRKRDQGGIKDQINAGYLKGKLVVERNDYFLQGLCGLKNGRCLWKENDYIAHFAPPNCPELHNFIKDFFDKYPRFVK